MNTTLWIVYTPSIPNIHGEIGFLISICTSNKFQIDLEHKLEIYREKFDRDPHLLDRGRIGVFDSIEDLRLFSFELAEKIGVDQLNIHTSEGLQQIIAEVNDATEMKEMMNKRGEIIPIENAKESGLWGRIFN